MQACLAKTNIKPGSRGPESYLTRLGTNEKMPLQRLMPNKANFHVVIFAGEPRHTMVKLKKLRLHLDLPNSASFVDAFGRNIVKTLTVFAVSGIAASEVMGGIKSFGRSYYDITQEAHQVYGIDVAMGALVVFRPDGYIGHITGLERPEDLIKYFSRFLVPAAKQMQKKKT